MKKWFLILTVGLMTLVFTACGESTEETGGTNEEGQSDLTMQDVYSKALEASKDMKSTEIEIELQQYIDTSEKEFTKNIDSSFTVEMTMDPLAVHMGGITNVSMDGEGDESNENVPGMKDMDIDIYLLNDVMYMYNEQMGNWIKKKNAGVDAVEEMTIQKLYPAEQLEMLEDYSDEFSFEESDDAFILSLDADGDEFNDLFQELVEGDVADKMMREMESDKEDMSDIMQIKSMSLEMTIDKETFYVKTYNINTDMTIKAEGQEMNIQQNLESEYSNIDGVDPIEVPEDIEEKAVTQ